jgi:anti-anti-sigma regulatory factor
MDVTIDRVQGVVPVTILHLNGDLDASNFQELIASVRELVQAGTRDLLFDMSNVPFISSAGIVALHSMALLLRGQQPSDPESGWEAFHALDRDLGSGLQQHMKLLNPHPGVSRTLEISGLKRIFELYTDLDQAIASFC